MVLIVSQMGYFAIAIMIIWNYNEGIFFVPLKLYSAYSAFVCLQAVINSYSETKLAIFILMIAKLI